MTFLRGCVSCVCVCVFVSELEVVKWDEKGQSFCVQSSGALLSASQGLFGAIHTLRKHAALCGGGGAVERYLAEKPGVSFCPGYLFLFFLRPP